MDIQSVDENITGYIKLLGAIIWRALCDLKSQDERLRESAKAFLTGGQLRKWCSYFNTTPKRIIRIAAKLSILHKKRGQ